MGKKVFVTVGTTKFDKLIDTASRKDILDIFHNLGYTFIQYQYGMGTYLERHQDGIKLQGNSYFENFGEEIDKADLVISHAGAGSCLEVLKRNKPLIVVINEDLMDNHQSELAEQLQSDGYLYYCTCSDLNETLLKDFTLLKIYPVPQQGIFSRYLDKCVGFTD